MAICEYNTGHLKTVADVQTASGLSPGTNTARIARQLDKRRLNLAEKRKSTKYEVFRKKKKLALLKEEEKRQEKEGLSYDLVNFENIVKQCYVRKCVFTLQIQYTFFI